jgi:hypothetical protein
MNRVERFSIITVVIGSLAVDSWLFLSRCTSSPPLAKSELAFGLLLQAAAVVAPFIVALYFSYEVLAFRLKAAAAPALLLFLWSVLIVEPAVLFGDAFGKIKGFKSVGQQCVAPVLSDGT